MAALSHPHLPTPLADSQPAQANSNPLTTNSTRPSLSPRSSSTPRSSISDRSHDAPPPSATTSQPQQRPSITPANPSKARRSSSNGLLNRAAAALDRTQSAIASLSDPVIRPRQSNSALARLSLSSTAAPVSTPISEPPSPEKVTIFNISSSQSLAALARLDRSLAHSGKAKPRPEPVLADPAPAANPRPSVTRDKMHQTSSRLLRMTDDDRPFTRDFKDLFATLIVSLLPLTPHRVRLSKVDYTFLSEDAINNLGSLKFSQSNRMPDPKDSSRIVTTTTTTTFSMAKDMARSICQRFVEARFIESADGKYQQHYSMKGSVWQLTAKGITVLDRFCARNGIQQKQVAELVSMNSAQLVILERDMMTDKLLSDLGTIEVIFRRFVGADGRNVKSSTNAADSDSLHDYRDGLTGVKMAAERKVNGRIYRDTFTGRATTDWLMDCSTIVDRRETVEIATLFVEYGLIEPVVPDRTFIAQNTGYNLFQPTKYAIYQLTQQGKDLISGVLSRGRISRNEGSASSRNGISRDSNTQRLDRILNDAALRLLFRENLRDTHCEENLSFHQDVAEFVRACKASIAYARESPSDNAMEGIKEVMAQAYGIYNAFLAPGSPCELNIDHQLRNNLATRMTKAIGQDVSMVESLGEVMILFEDAQNAVFKLMASDSVPKFLRNAKYEQLLRSYDLDPNGRGAERSQSRSNQI